MSGKIKSEVYLCIKGYMISPPIGMTFVFTKGEKYVIDMRDGRFHNSRSRFHNNRIYEVVCDNGSLYMLNIYEISKYFMELKEHRNDIIDRLLL